MDAIEYLKTRLDEPKLAEAALEWFNVRFEGEMTAEDKQYLLPLITLVNNGNFSTFTCDCCGSTFSNGRPENWDNFQGVCEDEGGPIEINNQIKEICGHCLMTNQLFF